MIIGKCPLKISLVGDLTSPQSFIDKYGRVSAISFTSNLFTYTILKPHKLYRIVYSTIEETSNISDIKNKIVREVLSYYNVPSVEIIFTCDIPSTNYGLVSSSSYLLSMIKAVSKFMNLDLSIYKIIQDAINIEQKVNHLVDYHDIYGCALGGLKRLDFYKSSTKIEYLDDKLLSNMFLYLLPVKTKYSPVINILRNIDDDKLLKHVDDINLNDYNSIKSIINNEWEIKKSTITNFDEIKYLDHYLSEFNCVRKLCNVDGNDYFFVLSETYFKLTDSIPIKLCHDGVKLYGEFDERNDKNKKCADLIRLLG